MMKARIHGIEVEGTPEEMAALLKLVGETQEPTVTITWPSQKTWASISDSITAQPRGMLWHVI